MLSYASSPFNVLLQHARAVQRPSHSLGHKDLLLNLHEPSPLEPVQTNLQGVELFQLPWSSIPAIHQLIQNIVWLLECKLVPN